jgi:outer membrane usher protein
MMLIKELMPRVPACFSCRHFGVSRSSFYYWLKDKKLARFETKKNIGIPLNNGLNTITLEVRDESGRIQILEFQQTSSLQLLHKGESNFDLTLGHVMTQAERERRYEKSEPMVFSGFYQYGLTSQLTLGAYGQNQSDFILAGTQIARATKIGLFSLGGAYGKNGSVGGGYTSLAYQLSQIGRSWHRNSQLNFSVDFRDKSFQANPASAGSQISSQWRAQYTTSLLTQLSATLGASLTKLRDNLPDRRGLDLGSTLRLSSRASLSMYASRKWDELQRKDDQVYAFLTWTFPERGANLQSTYSSPQNSKRVTVSNDPRQRLNSVRARASIEHQSQSEEAELDLNYAHQAFEIGARGLVRNYNDTRGRQERYTVSAASTLVFALDRGMSAFELTRPLNGSFAIFKGSNFDGPIDVRGLGMYKEGARGPLGNAVYPNLIPYQYRELYLDSLQLEPGQTYEQEHFVLYPRYRSGHLIPVELTGSFALRGLILIEDAPLALKVGVLRAIDSEQEILFFTNRQGEFFIDGVMTGQYELVVDKKVLELVLSEGSAVNGILNLGVLQ